VLDPFHLVFVQRGVLEVLLLAPAAGLLGTWIVMRGLSFYAHAVGTAAFPGLVLADGLGFSAPLGAFAAALVFAFGVERLARRPRAGYDSLTALALVAALAGGVVLASDVFHSGGNIDSLLFGSLLLTGTRDLLLAALASAAAVAATLVLGPRWLARGFDPGSARALGLRSGLPDALLLTRVAFAVIASLTAIGALLATALFACPRHMRLWTQRRRSGSSAGGARGGPGHRRPVALGRAEPPGPPLPCSAALHILVWHRRRRRAHRLPRARRSCRIVLSACGGLFSNPVRMSRRRRRSATGSAVGGDAVHAQIAAQYRSARTSRGRRSSSRRLQPCRERDSSA
jgi:ABC-type Mn2+/Zn2+ transport system permease subunit